MTTPTKKGAKPGWPTRRTFERVPLNKVRVEAERDTGTANDFTELAASIHEVGLIEPIVVAALRDGTYTLICGYRRLRALWTQHFEEPDAGVEAIVCHGASPAWIANARREENLQRKPYSAAEERALVRGNLTPGAELTQYLRESAKGFSGFVDANRAPIPYVKPGYQMEITYKVPSGPMNPPTQHEVVDLVPGWTAGQRAYCEAQSAMRELRGKHS